MGQFVLAPWKMSESPIQRGTKGVSLGAPNPYDGQNSESVGLAFSGNIRFTMIVKVPDRVADGHP